LRSEAGGEQPALVSVCDKLQNRLGSLVGATGFRTLLHRALAIGQREYGSLRRLSVAETGTLAGFGDFASALTPGQVAAASAALVGHVIVLLETFIGEELTRQLLAEIWTLPKPSAPPEDPPEA
jgi:hypothetical protein